MGPRETRRFSTVAVENLWEQSIELNVLVKVAFPEAFAILGVKLICQLYNQFASIQLRARCPSQLLFNDALAEKPVAQHKRNVHRTSCDALGAVDNRFRVGKDVFGNVIVDDLSVPVRATVG